MVLSAEAVFWAAPGVLLQAAIPKLRIAPVKAMAVVRSKVVCGIWP